MEEDCVNFLWLIHYLIPKKINEEFQVNKDLKIPHYL